MMNAQVQSFLGFDWGQLRIGVASGNTLTGTAHSVTTLTEQGEARQQAIAKLVREWRPTALVTGVPYHPDGAPHKNTKLAKEFAQKLREWTGLVVHEVDERYSTTEAKAEYGSAHGWQNTDNQRANIKANSKVKNKAEKKIDALSACVILEQYMRGLV
jgi:putative Holliday junction resolvase